MLLVIAGVVGFDQASKIAIEAALQPGQAFPILGDWFRFLLVYNPGAAFSLGSESSTWLFTTFQLVFLVGVLLASPRIDDRFQAIALAMVAGGAGGNLVDRLFREPGFWFGHVVDFISPFSMSQTRLSPSVSCCSWPRCSRKSIEHAKQ